MFGKKTKSGYKHVLVFVKPKFSRDKGIIRLCRNDPENRFKLKTVSSIDDYLNNEQYEYTQKSKKRNNDKIKRNDKKCRYPRNNEKSLIYHGIIPIMYLSEWKTSNEDYKKFFSQSLCRGFPRLQIISHKGNLANLLNKFYQKKCHEKLIKNELFYPRTYVVPSDNHKFFIENQSFCNPTNFAENYDNNNIKFIIKPQGKSKGHGISLVTKKSDIDFEEFVIIQKYINNPLLINNHKFDLRLYVFIASINPLQIYIYDKGLVRFATAEYSKNIHTDSNDSNDSNDSEDINNNNKENNHNVNKNKKKDREINNQEILCSHLTNFTLNKKHENYKNKNKEIKWSLEQFWVELEEREKELELKKLEIKEECEDKENESKENNFDDDNKMRGYLKEYILNQVYDIIGNVFKIGYTKLNEGFSYQFTNNNKNHGRCFDILGMDVLIDTNYKCWLMEFNRYPSLKCEHQIDKNIKYDLCNDLFKMLKPRIICNHNENIMYHHKMPIILDPTNTNWKRIM